MTDVVVASTTDNVADVRAAAEVTASDLADGGLLQPLIDKPAPGESESAETTPDAGVESPDEEQHEPTHNERRPRPRNAGWQKRVDRITARNYALEEALESSKAARRALEERLSRLETTVTKGSHAEESEPAGADTSERYVPQHAREPEFLPAHEVQRRAAELADIRAQESRDADRIASLAANHNARLEAAVARHHDPEALKAAMENINVPQELGIAILHQENSEQIVVFLAENPGVAGRLMSLGPAGAFAELPRLAGFIAGRSERPPVLRRNAAVPPKPIRPVGGSSTTSSVELDQADFATYKRVREQQEKSRRSR